MTGPAGTPPTTPVPALARNALVRVLAAAVGDLAEAQRVLAGDAGRDDRTVAERTLEWLADCERRLAAARRTAESAARPADAPAGRSGKTDVR